MAKLISKTYADALFEIAIEQNKVDSLMEEASSMKQILIDNCELCNLLNHPQIMKEEKIKVVEDIFKGRISDEILGLFVIIVQKDRFKVFQDVLDYFIDEIKEYKGIGVAYVTSAIELNEIQKSNIVEKLLKTTKYNAMEMIYIVDKKLIGGMIIRVNDRVVDSSLATKLATMQADLHKIQLKG